MSDQYEENAMKIIARNAQESGNPHAFYSGMVFGLAHAYEFLRSSDRETAAAYIATLLERIDEVHFKAREQ